MALRINRPAGGTVTKAPAQKKYRAPRVLHIKRKEEIINSSARETEDVVLASIDLKGQEGFISPPYDFLALERLVQRNSVLMPLIAAMEINIDGTGFEIIAKKPGGEDGKMSEKQIKQAETIEGFFAQVFPGSSFKTERRKMRNDQEKNGNGYLEVIRNLKGELVFLRRLESKTLRLMKLGPSVKAVKKIKRGTAEAKITMEVRERRYMQSIGGVPVYFKEFGASRDLDKNTGLWAEPNETLPADKRSTELIHFTQEIDVATPYGVPRWISSSPSVVGARKAEEFNLEFFDAGGIPPLLIIVQGGALAENAEQALSEHFAAQGADRHQAAVIEAFSTSGDMDSNQNVKVTVERFGADRQKDSMFESYIEKCDNRVRRSFRLAEIFLGTVEDLSFATAFASYTVAEAQVFAPERAEFDEKINLLILPLLPGGEDFEFKSMPISVSDANLQLKAMELVMEHSDKKSFFDTLQQVTDLPTLLPNDAEFVPASEQAALAAEREDSNLERDRVVNATIADGKARNVAEGKNPRGGKDAKDAKVQVGDRKPTPTAARTPNEDGAPRKPRSNLPGKGAKKKSDDIMSDSEAESVHGLAKRAAQCMQDGMQDLEVAQEWAALMEVVDGLPAPQQAIFKALTAVETFPEWHHDPAGASELASAALAVQHCGGHQ